MTGCPRPCGRNRHVDHPHRRECLGSRDRRWPYRHGGRSAPAAVGPDLAGSQKFTVTLPGGGVRPDQRPPRATGRRRRYQEGPAGAAGPARHPGDRPAESGRRCRLGPAGRARADPGVCHAALRIPRGPAGPAVPGDVRQRERAMRRTIPFIRQMETPTAARPAWPWCSAISASASTSASCGT